MLSSKFFADDPEFQKLQSVLEKVRTESTNDLQFSLYRIEIIMYCLDFLLPKTTNAQKWEELEDIKNMYAYIHKTISDRLVIGKYSDDTTQVVSNQLRRYAQDMKELDDRIDEWKNRQK